MNHFEITDADYAEMARDLDAMAEAQQQALYELEQLKNGERVLVPVSVDHAQSMFKIACFYLQMHDPEFKLRMSYD